MSCKVLKTMHKCCKSATSYYIICGICLPYCTNLHCQAHIYQSVNPFYWGKGGSLRKAICLPVRLTAALVRVLEGL
jgi:hypothetical protein